MWTSTRAVVPGKVPVWKVSGGAGFSHPWEFRVDI